MIKRQMIALGVALVLCMGALTACGSAPGGGEGAPVDYAAVLEAARPPEENENMPILTAGDEDAMGALRFFGVSEADMQRYAISVSLMNVKAYGVAIILPAEGRQQAVLDAVNRYVEMQQNAQENYLPDQYEIARAALVRVAPTGEVLLAMTENALAVMQNLENGLREAG